jgi:VanZ family protein
MDFVKSFTYQFEDPDWLKKIGIAALISLIPLVGQFFVLGWLVDTTKRVIDKVENPMGDWSDFGGYFVKGLAIFVIGFIYALPIIIFEVCLYGIIFAMAGSATSDTTGSILGILTTCLSCLVFIYVILLLFVLPAAYANYAATGSFSAGLRFGEVFGLVRKAPGAYLLVVLGEILAAFLAGLGMILCIIGIIITAAYANAAISHLYGQAYNEASGNNEIVEAGAVS